VKSITAQQLYIAYICLVGVCGIRRVDVRELATAEHFLLDTAVAKDEQKPAEKQNKNYSFTANPLLSNRKNKILRWPEHGRLGEYAREGLEKLARSVGVVERGVQAHECKRQPCGYESNLKQRTVKLKQKN
jgi:hypothetical protein